MTSKIYRNCITREQKEAFKNILEEKSNMNLLLDYMQSCKRRKGFFTNTVIKYNNDYMDILIASDISTNGFKIYKDGKVERY